MIRFCHLRFDVLRRVIRKTDHGQLASSRASIVPVKNNRILAAGNFTRDRHYRGAANSVRMRINQLRIGGQKFKFKFLKFSMIKKIK